MRKILSLLLVVAMLFGMATTAFAYTDVSAAAQSGPVEKLSALGIIKGYADGTFKPENPITRAEFAAVIVRAMGLEAAAKLINSPTKFVDVNTDYAWAYGYINIASAKGIIKGDPDGKFRPGDKVNFAEAITMLLRAGGWDAACGVMDWPAGFVMKAVEFGLTKDVAFDANSATNRGAIAVMTYNALSMPMARWNDTAKTYENDAATLAARYLNAVEKTVVVTSVPNINSALKANQVITADGTMYVPTGVNPNTLLGRSVRVIKVGTDTYIYAADITAAANIITGVTYVASGTTASDIHYSDGDDEFTKDVASGAVYIRNNTTVSWNGLGGDDDLTLFLDSNGNVRFVIATAWSHSQYLVTAKTVKGVDGATENTFTLNCNCHFHVLSNTTFTKNGAVAAFVDLAVGDVVYVQADGLGNATFVQLFLNKVTGKVSAVSLNAKGEAVLTINGTNYVIDATAFDANDVKLDGAPITKDAIGSLVNFDATLKLNATGKARTVAGTTTALIGWVTKAVDTTNKVITVNVKGIVNDYTYLSSADVSSVVKDDYVALTQRADGKVTTVTEFTLGATYTVKAVDTTAKKITLADSSATPVLSIIGYSDSTFGVRLGAWGDVSILKTGDVVRFWAASGVVKYFEVNPSFAGHVYGKYIGMTSVEGTKYIYVNVKGEVKTYESAVTPGAGLNLVDISLNSLGVATAIANVTFEGAPHLFTVNTISGNVLTVTRNDSVVQIHDLASAVVYKADGSLGAMSDLKVGTVYARVMNGTTVVLVQIVNPT